jgi:FkbM family methyltransferase
MADLKTWLRTLQTSFPFLLEAKFDVQRTYRRLTRQPFEREFEILSYLDADGRCCVDVGANRGQSIDAIRLYQRGAEVVAFEPNPMLAERLARRFAADPKVTVHPFGLGASDGEFQLHLPVYRGWAFDGLASFNREATREWLEPRIIGFDDAQLEIRTYQCRVRRLDEFALKPSFIKIDVQGLEEAVLEGAVETLRASKPMLLVETGPVWDIPAVLQQVGYAPCRYDERTLVVNELGSSNTLFCTPDVLDRLERNGLRLVRSAEARQPEPVG